MPAHCKELMEYHNGHVAIHHRFNKRITALRTAVEKGDGSLDKDATSHKLHHHSLFVHQFFTEGYRKDFSIITASDIRI
jgi:hypothetical protein